VPKEQLPNKFDSIKSIHIRPMLVLFQYYENCFSHMWNCLKTHEIYAFDPIKKHQKIEERLLEDFYTHLTLRNRHRV